MEKERRRRRGKKKGRGGMGRRERKEKEETGREADCSLETIMTLLCKLWVPGCQSP